MKTIFISALMLLAFSFSSMAQNLITVQNGSKVQFYVSLDSAYVHSADGDTLYLPGGSYGSLTVDKRLHIIGVGHNPDSTKATAKTIMGDLYLNSGAANGSVTGISFQGGKVFNSGFNGYTISRCYINGSIYNVAPVKTNSNISITENIIEGELVFYRFSNSLISNNIFLSTVSISNNSVFKNNLLLYVSDGSTNISQFSNSTIENNISNIGTQGYSGCILKNNINFGVNGSSGGNQGSGNFLGVGVLDSIFVNFDLSTMQRENTYKADFHLAANSPYKNAGTDGTDIGIYGGTFPWKAGSIPYNPHIQKNSVSGTTDANGNLKVNITVEAQKH